MAANVGKSLTRREGPGKVSGKAKYIDDMEFPGMIHGVTVRSNVARGKIIGIHFEGDLPWDEITIVTAEDIDDDKNIVLIIEKDQPFLAKDRINHPGEPVVLLAHKDKDLLEKARKNIRIEVEEEPGAFTIEESLKKENIIWGEDNVLKSYTINKGHVDQVWKQADHIEEAEYSTGAQEQLYIENNGVVGFYDSEEGVTVWGSMQCPYYVHSALMGLWELPGDKVRIVQAETGGGFGGKEDYPSIISGHATLLAWKAGCPVKIIYDRDEDLMATTKRHPSKTIIKSAHKKDGTLLGAEINFYLDGGAYATLSSVVLSRGAIHAFGPYYCENVRVHAKALATNTPPHGAYRGFGAPQSIFAIERHLNKVAKKLNISAEQIRKKNFIKKGMTTATEQIIEEDVDFHYLLKKALKASNYHQKKKKFKQENKSSHIKKGISFSTFMHGAGFTGSGEEYLKSIAGVEVTKDGIIKVLASSTEIGQGANTIFVQVAADALRLPPEMIEVIRPDTNNVPNSGPTVASRTTMVVGNLIKQACEGLIKILREQSGLKKNYSKAEFKKACKKHIDQFGRLKNYTQYKQPSHITWDDKQYRGDAYGTYAWAVYVAEVEVNTLTYETKVKNFTALQEVGKVINPIMAEGQIEGGVAQGVGWAICEKVVYDKGKMLNNQMTNYIIFTSADMPKVKVIFEEDYKEFGPYGAKGIGELPMDGPAPAVINAVDEALQDDLSYEVDHIPMLPEDLMMAMGGVHE